MPKGTGNNEYTDRELLHIIQDCTTAGWATTTDIGQALGFALNGRAPKDAKGRRITPAQRVTARLVWMRRYGFLETLSQKEGDSPPREADIKNLLWRLTDIGHQLMGGQLSKTVINAIERMEPGSHLLMMRQLTQRGYINARPELAVAMRREYRHHEAQRKLKF